LNISKEGFSFAAGVDCITAGDSDAPAEYHNLQGMRVANPVAGNDGMALTAKYCQCILAWR